MLNFTLHLITIYEKVARVLLANGSSRHLVRPHIPGTAAAARAWSGYVDSLAHGAIHNATTGGLSGGGSHHSDWAEQLDFLAAGVVILFTMLQAIGVRFSSTCLCGAFVCVFTVRSVSEVLGKMRW